MLKTISFKDNLNYNYIDFTTRGLILKCKILAIILDYIWFYKHYNFFFLRFYLFFFRKRKGGREIRRHTLMCGCLLQSPYWGPGLQPKHVPWLGIELVTLWFAGWHSPTEPYQPGIINIVIYYKHWNLLLEL